MKIPSVHQVVLEGRQTFARFPLVLANAVVGAVVSIILIEHEGPARASVLFSILYAAVLGIPLLLATALTIEKMQFTAWKSVAAQLTGICLLVLYGISTPSYIDDIPLFQLYRLLLFLAAAHCLAAALPFLCTKEENGFWQFAMAFFVRILTSAFYSFVLVIGFSVGLAALDHLFGITVPGKRYGELFVLVLWIFSTWFFLAGVPRDYSVLESSSDYPKGLKIFSQHILAPLVLIYLVILYAYILKIAFLWSWPDGWVSRLIVGFSAMGMLALLFLFPLRDKIGTVRTFWRWFFVVLIPLIVLLPLAVMERISMYGITESRYLGFAVAAWLGAMALYFLLAKVGKIQIIPLSLCAVMLLVGIGPWSAFSVSENNQIRRLKEVLVRNEILVGDTVCKAKQQVSVQDAQRVSGIISYLRSVHGYQRIQPWFREPLQSDTGSGIPAVKNPNAVTRLLGIEYVASWATGYETSLFLSTDDKHSIDIAGYDRMAGTFFVGKFGQDTEVANQGISFKFLEDGYQLEFMVESKSGAKEPARINIEELAARVVKIHGNTGVRNLPGDTLSASVQAAGRTIKIFFRSIQLERRQGKLVPVSCRFDIALTKQ